MTRMLAPRDSRIREQQRPERFGLALGDAARRLVEQEHGRLMGEDAREVDDAPAARGQLVHELVAERAEPHELDQLLDPVVDCGLGVDDRGEVQRGGERVADVHAALERDGDRLGDGERREEAAVLERATEAEPGPHLR